MNIDVLKDEIDTLKGELLTSCDPAAQKRIMAMIDERQSIIAEQGTAPPAPAGEEETT